MFLLQWRTSLSPFVFQSALSKCASISQNITKRHWCNQLKLYFLALIAIGMSFIRQLMSDVTEMTFHGSQESKNMMHLFFILQIQAFLHGPLLI